MTATSQPPSTEYLFIVDTETRAPFAQEMGAYLTGNTEHRFSVCARSLAELYAQETGEAVNKTRFTDILGVHERDEDAEEYVAHWPTPGWFNNGMGGHFREGQEEEAQQHWRLACLEQSRSTRLVHPNDQEANRLRWEESAAEPCRHRSAYMSVALVFTRELLPEEIEFLRSRAMKFPEIYRQMYAHGGDELIAVTNTRVVRKETAFEEVEEVAS